MPSTPTTTKPSTPRLSDQARHLSSPTGVTSTGWPAVRRTCVEKMGITFDPWQESVGRLILAKRDDGHLASMIDGVGMSLPRQVGKTYLISALVFALCVNSPNLLVIWTAHHLKTSGETFLALQAFASRSRIKPFVKFIHTGSGDEEVAFHNGSRILFGARERGFGRGIPGVDVLIFDEAQILSDKALANMLATLNTSQFGLQLYIGTPPKPEDMSESFTRMRNDSIKGTLHDGAWVEFGADPTAHADDRAQWSKANPSYPKRTPVQSMLRLKRKLTDADWRREGLGIWDENAGGDIALSVTRWRSAELVKPKPDGPVSYGVKFSKDGKRAAIAVGVPDGLGGAWVEVVQYGEQDALEVSAWLTATAPAANRTRAASMAGLVVDGFPGAPVLLEALRRARVPSRRVTAPTVAQVVAAHQSTFDAVANGTISHSDQPGLNAAVGSAGKRLIGLRGGWGWEQVGEADILPLEAATLAYWAATSTTKRATGAPPRKIR